MNIGYATSLAYVCGAVSMILFGWLSDRIGDRRGLLSATCLMATAGLAIAGATMGTWWSLASMCLATAGFYGTKGPFWAMPTMILTGAAAAGGIAFINAFGNIGGAVGPAVVGWLKDTTGSYAGGLYGLAIFTGISAIIAAVGLHIPRRCPSGRAGRVSSSILGMGFIRSPRPGCDPAGGGILFPGMGHDP
jgi:ACS family tartrate transporter-like MFS transporter